MRILSAVIAILLLFSLLSCRDTVNGYEVLSIKYGKDPDIDIRPAHEVIYEDDNYYYCLGNIESEYYIVTYKNGEKQNIKDALAEGKITLKDLDNNQITYFAEPKQPPIDEVKTVKSITDNSHGLELPDMEEVFYEDYSRKYIFGNPISDHITVEYTDGSTENVKDALKNGNITVADLDFYGISYFPEPKFIRDIVDLTENGDILTADALEGFYCDEKYYYYFPSIKSGYVTVYYKDGTEQNVKDALKDGKILISDLDYFSVGYYKDPVENYME
ncbi:MAG: hypothetical protein IKV54_06610 [Clostridia bacterium]|nr:hypothetical protein [Clostridia bacterium]